jgi:predicted nucleotidyltransferase
MKYSILIYGSSIRGNSDKYSDKDLLIVAEEYNVLNSLKDYYSQLGWSVSTYTYDKLNYLSINGYLFVKHLILEGEIIFDTDNSLHSILKNFKECVDYVKEMKKASFFLNFIQEIPDNVISYSWLLDNTYLTLRNYLIYESALKKEYNFGYIDLVNNLLSENRITQTEAEKLFQLRVIKSCYRNNFDDISPSKDFTEDIISIVNNIGLRITTSFSQSRLNFEKINFNNIDSAYKKLRLIELVLKNESIEDQYLNKCISNPQMYASNKSIEKIHLKVLEKIKTLHKHRIGKMTI